MRASVGEDATVGTMDGCCARALIALAAQAAQLSATAAMECLLRTLVRRVAALVAAWQSAVRRRSMHGASVNVLSRLTPPLTRPACPKPSSVLLRLVSALPQRCLPPSRARTNLYLPKSRLVELDREFKRHLSRRAHGRGSRTVCSTQTT